jgi:hypothetical protein
MRNLAKLAMGAVMAGGLALAAAAPADAQVSIGIGVGPGYHHDWCYHHPYRCNRGYYGGYPDGYFMAGRGYWWHGGWYGHRHRDHDGWRYWH